MKQVSAEYKNQIKEMGREIDSVITYYNHYQIITENNKYILTEDGQKILTEQIKQDSNINITAEDIYSCKVITHGDLLKTMMKEFDFEVKQDIKIGSLVSYKFGLKVNNSYEYVDYGMFIVNKKEYNEDTQTYSYVAYDKMLFTMIPYVAEDISERQGAYTLYDLVNYCCEFCNLQLGVETFPNGEREITDDILKSLESSNFTFRDILDYATEVTGCSSYMIDDSFVIMPPQETKSDNLVPPINSHETSGITFSTNDDGITTISGKATATYSEYYARDIPLKAGTYTFSVTKTGDIPSNSSQIILVLSDNTRQVINLWSPVAKTFTIASDLSIRYYYYYTNKNMTYNATVAVVLKQGTDSDYIPYGKLILKEDSFKDANVKFNEVFGPINSILFSRSEDTDVIEIKDDDSIQANGVTQIKIKDNPFLEGNDRADYFEEMFDVLNGLTYSLNDVSSTGITYLEFNDKYKVNIDENEYDCLLLNDEIIVEQGLEENIFTEMPQEKQQEYVTSTANVDDVSLRVDKANKQIVLKVDSEGKLALAELKQNADNGTEFNVKADNIKLEGYTTINGGFSVDLNGNMACNNATINGGDITLYGEHDSAKLSIQSTNSDGWSSFGPEGIYVDNGNNGSFFVEMHERTAVLNLGYNYSSMRFYVNKDNPGSNGISFASFDNGTTNSATLNISPKNIYMTAFPEDGTIDMAINGRKVLEASYTGVYLYNSSLEEYKKNIKEFNNALDLIKNTNVYSFNYKNEEDEKKPHIGVIIGKGRKTPTEMLNNDNDGADYNNMTSICIQAIKEQQEEIKKLKKEIEDLKERIDK